MNVAVVNTNRDQSIYKVRLQGLSDESVQKKEFNDVLIAYVVELLRFVLIHLVASSKISFRPL